MSEIIPPEEITIARIRSIFDSLLLETSLTPQNELCITEQGLKTFIAVDPERQLLKFFLIFGFHADSLPDAQLDLVNELNKNIVFMRAWTFGSGIVFDYALPYDAGLIAEQVISAYQWLVRAALGGLQEYDTQHLVL